MSRAQLKKQKSAEDPQVFDADRVESRKPRHSPWSPTAPCGGSSRFDQLRSARAARSVPVLVLPLDIEPLFDMPELELLLMPVLPVLDEEPPMLEPELLEPDELPMPLELVDPLVEGEPLAGCERSPCERPELGGVVVLLEEPPVPIVEPAAPVAPIVEPVVPMVEPVPVVEPDC